MYHRVGAVQEGQSTEKSREEQKNYALYRVFCHRDGDGQGEREIVYFVAVVAVLHFFVHLLFWWRFQQVYRKIVSSHHISYI